MTLEAPTAMEWGLATLWVLWVLQAFACFLQAGRFRARIERGEREKYAGFRPPAVVIVPFKGIDRGAVNHVQSLFKQDYPSYRVLCVVESELDPAYTLLKNESAKFPSIRCDIVVAGLSDPHTGQKVFNQCAALRHLAASRTRTRHPDEAWVFADSDAIPNADWLAKLVGPLKNRDRNAVTTGYRWLVPERGARKKFLWGGRFASAINAGAATFMAHPPFAFAWGGSMAMLADTAAEGDLMTMWNHALSDDYQVTRMVHRLGKRIYFLPSCMVESPVDMSVSEFIEFARRQYIITRVHEPLLFYKATLAVGVYTLGYVTALTALIAGLLRGDAGLWMAAGTALLLVAAFDQFKNLRRRRTVHQLFRTGTYQRLRSTLWLDQFGMPLIMTVNLALLLSTLFTRTITWRGRTYRMLGPQRILELQRIAAHERRY